MYKCNECKNTFSEPDIITETHGFKNPPFDKRNVCPFCGSDSYEEIDEIEEDDDE